MSTLTLCLECGAAGFGLGALLGYGVPKLWARSVARAVERERVVAALAGEQPSAGEHVARELEKAAVAQAKQGLTATSQSLLDQAANVRARGRQR